MKICLSWCFVAIVFLVANLYVAFTADKGLLKRDFYKVLSKSQIEKYNELVKERRNIYLQGYFVGFIISLIFIAVSKNYRGGKLLNTGVICIAGAITLVVNYLYYMMYPKKDYMILYLNNVEQKQAWLNIYKHMQYKYHLGLVLGIVASMILAKATC
jgi:hypothetical protein